VKGRIVHTRAPAADEESTRISTKIKNQTQKATEKIKDEIHRNQNSKHQNPEHYSYVFEANKIQLQGTLPADLRNKYVDYRPFIGWLFTGRGIRGCLLQRGLHAQHRRIYSYNTKTTYGHVTAPPAIVNEGVGDAQKFVLEHEKPDAKVDELAASRQFLKMVHYDEAPTSDVLGGRLYTYVITLQREWRFSETGSEFAIQFLSKHSMHSDLATEVAASGEFFVRRRRGKGGMPLSDGEEEGTGAETGAEKEKKEGCEMRGKTLDNPDAEAKGDLSNASIPAKPDASDKKAMAETPGSNDKKEQHTEQGSQSNGQHEQEEKEDADSSERKEKHENRGDKESIHISHKPSHLVGRSRHPSNFVLVIDNDSGTYRPDKSQLPSLQKYLERNFPGLKIKAIACDDPKLKKWKEEQKPEKETANARQISQPNSSSNNGSDFQDAE
jgi:hypothetical protein